MKKQNRLDFSRKVVETLYKKSNGRCSVPRCTRPTMGPLKNGNESINMGVACHIYSAAENGPRGRGDKDDKFIRSESNGIWCCAYHAALIDKANGKDYPASVLLAWKALIEARTLKHMTDRPSPLGWVETIQFTEFANSTVHPKATLSRNTLIFGPNCSGKSALMEFTASISNSRYCERFSGTKTKNSDGTYSPARYKARITYSTVDTLSKNVDIELSGENLIRYEDSKPCLLSPGDLEVIFCTEREQRIYDGEDNVDFLMRFLNVDNSALYAISKLGSDELLPRIIRFEQATEYDYDRDEEIKKRKPDGSPYMELQFKHSHSDDWISYDCLSTSEQGKLLIDLAITKAREVSKQRLTLLLIDDPISNFDSENFKWLLNVLSNSDFQSAVVLPPYRHDDVLDHENNNTRLQTLDYLEQWRLVTLKNPRH